jgi:hypothetical protein
MALLRVLVQVLDQVALPGGYDETRPDAAWLVGEGVGGGT